MAERTNGLREARDKTEQERVKAKWERVAIQNGEYIYACTNCYSIHRPGLKTCPSCNAKMEGRIDG